MKLKKREVRSLNALMAQHEGLEVLKSFRGIPRGDRSMAYPVAAGGRVGWWRQVCYLAGVEDGRHHWTAAVVRTRRPANAAAVIRAVT
jgi:hypothetical protein